MQQFLISSLLLAVVGAIIGYAAFSSQTVTVADRPMPPISTYVGSSASGGGS